MGFLLVLVPRLAAFVVVGSALMCLFLVFRQLVLFPVLFLLVTVVFPILGLGVFVIVRGNAVFRGLSL